MKEKEDFASLCLWLYIFVSLLFVPTTFVSGWNVYSISLLFISVGSAGLVTVYYASVRKPTIPLFIISFFVFGLLLLHIVIYGITYFHGIFIGWTIFVWIITGISILPKRRKKV